MHKNVLEVFVYLKNLWEFIKIFLAFLLMLLMLFWIQNITHSNWPWLDFITPFFNVLLGIAQSINIFSINFGDSPIQIEYIISVILLAIVYIFMNVLLKLTDSMQEKYEELHYNFKKYEEKKMNTNFKSDIKQKELAIKKFDVVISTSLKNTVKDNLVPVSLDEQNRLMNNFIEEKLNVKHTMFHGGFMYSFEDFSSIDSVLEVLFRVLHSNAPINYAICIQIDKKYSQLEQLIDLRHFSKITMAADTAYRYKYNQNQNYQILSVGIFQYNGMTIEVDEFQEFS